ncbi:hypothetical protein [Campylobacter coli]|uniref:hypothetical protein n=1 Tax=Campylobacter coli TaxID=195 RepID=UPI00219A39C5|nr:peptide-binding protein [Campylobacter coli]MCL4568767.1 peptide-binding protein [Campylobacter coli]MCL4573452.1 peptide-binding protein [Campylobacter coli]MCL4575221.1 peptide-binding protein [Campylobacter coli]WFB03206.1 peptide-binding protein [Campylobacter coli]
MVVGNLGAQKAKRNDTPISAKKDIMGDKTVRVRADLHHIISIRKTDIPQFREWHSNS